MRWGNSLALRIPKILALDAKLEKGTQVELSLEDGQIIIKPIQQKEFTLEELLAGVTDENIHDEIKF